MATHCDACGEKVPSNSGPTQFQAMVARMYDEMQADIKHDLCFKCAGTFVKEIQEFTKEWPRKQKNADPTQPTQ